tara:strand:- start:5 stop:766 length:762 start_codon:yes stop_codon:yes gene_type:complete
MENYSNFLTIFKGEFWNFCNNNNLFIGIPESNFDKVKVAIDNVVSNYQNQIQQNNNKPLLFQVLAKELNSQLNSLKIMNSQQIQNEKSSQFQQDYENKQNEFNKMMKKELPKQPEFNDEEKDEPLTNENLDELLQKQMKERENLVKNSFDLSGNPEPIFNIPEKNTIIATKPNNPEPSSNSNELKQNLLLNNSMQMNTLNQLPTIHERQDNLNEGEKEKLFELLNKISDTQKIQNSILNKLIVSQISILEKLK